MAHLGLVGSCSMQPALNWVPTTRHMSWHQQSCAAVARVLDIPLLLCFSGVAVAGVASAAGTESGLVDRMCSRV
jgi:hypothetical protein